VTVNGTASNELKLLQLAASVERNSEHPLAEAVVQYTAQSQQLELADARDFEAVRVVAFKERYLINSRLRVGRNAG